MHHGATLEQINDQVVISGLELGFLDILAKEYADLTPLLVGSFEFDDKTKTYNLRKDKKFKTHIPLELRVRENSTCESCQTVDCIKGRRDPVAPAIVVQRGCELARPVTAHPRADWSRSRA